MVLNHTKGQTMRIYDSPVLLKMDVQAEFTNSSGDLQQVQQDKIQAALDQGSSLPTLIETMESIWAYWSSTPPQWQTLCCQCAQMVNANRWWDKGDRAGLIMVWGSTQLGDPITDFTPPVALTDYM
jgi:hypothetical protein